MWNGETYDFTSRRWVSSQEAVVVFVRVLLVPKVAILMEKMMVNIDEAWDFRVHYCLDKASFWVFGWM